MHLLRHMSRIHEMNPVVQSGKEVRVRRAYDIHLGNTTCTDELQYYEIKALHSQWILVH